MDKNILDSLEDLKWAESQSSQNGSKLELDSIGIGNWINYSNLVCWITTELKALHSAIDESVTPIHNLSEDLPSFKIQLGSILKELRCPSESLINLPISDRFESPQSRKTVLNFLLSELEAGRMIYINKSSNKHSLKVSLDESKTAKILREVCQELDVGKPPDSITPKSLWDNILPRVKSRAGSVAPLDPLFTGVLTPSQWTVLDTHFEELKSDYTMRREMLLKRLDVTVQSFHWADRLKGAKEEKMSQEFRNLRPAMEKDPSVEVSNILAARSDLAIVEKTSSTSVRKNTRSAVNKVVIGKVPDRGGRPDEVEPPPPEMPSWQQRQGGGPSGSSGWIQNPNQRGRGGGGGGGGGRVQGGWSGHRGGGGGHQQQQQSGGYGQGQRDYQDNYQSQRGGQGGYHQGQGGDYNQGQGGGYNQGYQGRGQHQGGQRAEYYQHDSRDDYNQGGDGGGYQQDFQRGDRGGRDYHQGGGGQRRGGRGGGGRY